MIPAAESPNPDSMNGMTCNRVSVNILSGSDKSNPAVTISRMPKTKATIPAPSPIPLTFPTPSTLRVPYLFCRIMRVWLWQHDQTTRARL